MDHCPEIQIPEEKDIEALSKSDVFTKIFACLQSAWLVVQCIARACQQLPITQLELSTIAFITCGIGMYLLWWDKPFGVERRELLVAIDWEFETASQKEREKILRDTQARAAEHAEWLRQRREASDIWKGFLQPDYIELEDLTAILQIMYRTMRRLLGIPTSSNCLLPSETGGTSLAFYFAGALFSAFHVLAWNWDFPSKPTKIAWRVCAITAMCGNLVVFCVLRVSRRSKVNGGFFYDKPLMIRSASWIAVVTSVIYCLARLGLIVLIFYCFSSMPVTIYQTVNWTKFLPHFS